MMKFFFMPTKARPNKKSRSKTPHRSDATHILLKLRSEDGQTIGAHNEVLRAKGTALLGKFGKNLAADFCAILNEQVRMKIPTFLFLTLREGWNGPYVTYRARLLQVTNDLPAGKIALVPVYYRSEVHKAKNWFEIADLVKLPREEMNQITVTSSGRSIMSVINSSATFFRVRT